MSEIIHVQDQYYILATSPLADRRTRVLKHGDTFAVFDRYGEIQPTGLGEQGLYHDGTRFLSHLSLTLGMARPLLLSSTVKEDNILMTVDLTNPDFHVEGQVELPRGTLHLARSKFLLDGACYETLRLRNYGRGPVELQLAVQYQADYADVFEVRGAKRERRGQRLPEHINFRSVELAYRGLDDVVRRTRLLFDPAPEAISETEARWPVRVDSRSEVVFAITVRCDAGAAEGPELDSATALRLATNAAHFHTDLPTEISTSNETFNVSVPSLAFVDFM